MTSNAEGRYARQVILREVGAAGQRRIREGCVVVEGRSAAARVCALYLAGAGVGRLEVAPSLAVDVRAQNPEADVRSGSNTPRFAVRIEEARGPWTPALAPTTAGPVDVGASAALAVLRRLLETK